VRAGTVFENTNIPFLPQFNPFLPQFKKYLPVYFAEYQFL